MDIFIVDVFFQSHIAFHFVSIERDLPLFGQTASLEIASKVLQGDLYSLARSNSKNKICQKKKKKVVLKCVSVSFVLSQLCDQV